MKKPLTEKEEITKAAYNKYGKAWAKKYKDSKFWLPEIKKLYQLQPGGRLLDVGCGAGRDAERLIPLGYDYVGTDISETVLAIARKNLPGQKFLEQSVYELSFPYKFDAFWCAAVLLHVPKERIDEALQGIKSVLKPGAVGFISIKRGQGEEIENYEIGGNLLSRYYAYWSREDFTKALNKNGFKVLRYAFRPESDRQLWHCFFVKAD